MFALMGPHRSGKTTLMLAAGEKLGIATLKTDTSGVFARHGRDPQAEYTFKERLWLQERILDGLIEQYGAMSSDEFLTDRTPLDVLTYTMLDIQRRSVYGQADVGRAMQEHWERCYRETFRWFRTVIYLWPGIKLQADPTKAPPCEWYIEHFAIVGAGLLHQRHSRSRVPLSATEIPAGVNNLQDRVELVSDAIMHYRHEIADLIDAHKLSIKNSELLKAAGTVGCFQCLRTFDYSAIREFIKDSRVKKYPDRLDAQTALCPYCSVDSVVPNTDTTFLRRMMYHFFSRELRL